MHLISWRCLCPALYLIDERFIDNVEYRARKISIRYPHFHSLSDKSFP
jgi:hypothetical protein